MLGHYGSSWDMSEIDDYIVQSWFNVELDAPSYFILANTLTKKSKNSFSYFITYIFLRTNLLFLSYKIKTNVKCTHVRADISASASSLTTGTMRS